MRRPPFYSTRTAWSPLRRIRRPPTIIAGKRFHRIFVHSRYSKQPQDDLAHILLRWQEQGIVIESKFAWKEEAPETIAVRRPSWYRAAWYRVVVLLGLHRNDAGGFGGFLRSLGGGG
jgi:hypothetical protein